MPELPEVETVRRQLEPEVVGKESSRPRSSTSAGPGPEPPAAVERGDHGRRIEAVGRRGKYLILRLSGDAALVMHLRMTGNLLLRGPEDEVADLMEPDRLGAPRLYEASPSPSPAGPARARRRVGAPLH